MLGSALHAPSESSRHLFPGAVPHHPQPGFAAVALEHRSKVTGCNTEFFQVALPGTTKELFERLDDLFPCLDWIGADRKTQLGTKLIGLFGDGELQGDG